VSHSGRLAVLGAQLTLGAGSLPAQKIQKNHVFKSSVCARVWVLFFGLAGCMR